MGTIELDVATIIGIVSAIGTVLCSAIATLWVYHNRMLKRMMNVLEDRTTSADRLKDRIEDLHEARLKDIKDYETRYVEVLRSQDQTLSNLNSVVATLVEQLGGRR